jgi:hypothetical protein
VPGLLFCETLTRRVLISNPVGHDEDHPSEITLPIVRAAIE